MNVFHKMENAYAAQDMVQVRIVINVNYVQQDNTALIKIQIILKHHVKNVWKDMLQKLVYQNANNALYKIKYLHSTNLNV